MHQELDNEYRQWEWCFMICWWQWCEDRAEKSRWRGPWPLGRSNFLSGSVRLSFLPAVTRHHSPTHIKLWSIWNLVKRQIMSDLIRVNITSKLSKILKLRSVLLGRVGNSAWHQLGPGRLGNHLPVPQTSVVAQPPVSEDVRSCWCRQL